MTTPFLYRFLRGILRYAAEIYFFDIQASGQEKIPEDGPLILAANHPNSLMDTVVMGIQTDRQVCYMARSGLFKNIIVRTIFNRVGVIPIYRTEELQGETERNQDSFLRAYEVLEEGGCIGMFPEGKNSPDRKVQELKTGTARIALAAEDRNDFQLGVKIQPVGLNFEDRERFLSSVLIRFGDPIDSREYADLYKNDTRDAVRGLTDQIQRDLRQVATHIDDDRNHQLVRDIYQIYGNELANEFIGVLDIDLRPLTHKLFDRARAVGGPRPDLEDRFTIEQHIARAVDYYQKNDPGLVARTRMDIRRYRDHLDQVRLRHDLIEEGVQLTGRRWEAVKLTAYALILGPVAIYGFINNAIPYAMTNFVVSRQPDRAMIAFAGFFTGLLAFPLFYFLQGWALWTLTDHSLVVVLLYIFSLPITGFFFLRWWRQILTYRNTILSRTLFRTQKNLLETLENERQDLIDRFERLKDQYVEVRLAKKELQDADPADLNAEAEKRSDALTESSVEASP